MQADQDLFGPLQQCWSYWLFGLWLCCLVDRASSKPPSSSWLRLRSKSRAVEIQPTRLLLLGADIIRAESRSLLLFGFTEGKREIKKERRIYIEEEWRVSLSNARSRSWHNYPGSIMPWEATAPDFSPFQGRPGHSSGHFASQNPSVISTFTPHFPPLLLLLILCQVVWMQ